MLAPIFYVRLARASDLVFCYACGGAISRDFVPAFAI